MVLVSAPQTLSRTVAPANLAFPGTGERSQCSAPLNAPPQLKLSALQDWVVLRALLLPWSRPKIVTESSGVLGSSVWNERRLPSRRSCVVWFSLVIDQ